jgi:hypothetical protein
MDLRLTSAVLLWAALFFIALHRAFQKSECSPTGWWRSFGLFAATLALALPVWRLRSLLYNGEINVDESQFLAQLLRYSVAPIPWRGVDGGSSGPLNTWVLAWAPLLGLKIDYFAARATSLICLWFTCSGLALSLSEIANRRLALLLTMPAVTLLLTTLNFDYVFLSSEQLPIVLISWITYFLARQFRQPSGKLAYGIGLLSGALPFCKIQAGPGAIYLWLVGAAVLWAHNKTEAKARRFFLIQILGGLTVPAIILSPVIITGAWGEFLALYIKAAAGYKSPGQGSGQVATPTLLQLVHGVPEFQTFSIVSLSLFVVFGIYLILKPRPILRKDFAGCVVIIGFAIVMGYSVSRSGFAFPHYTILLIPAVTLLGACLPFLIGMHKENMPQWLLVTASLLTPVLQGYRAYQDCSANKNRLGDWGSGKHPIGDILKQYAQPRQTIFVWGYAPKFYVISGLVPASRFMESISTLCLPPEAEDHPKSNLNLLIADLERSKPELFVDASDEFWFPNPNIPRGFSARHHNVRIISRFVSNNYQPVLQLNIGPQKVPIIIYKRKTAF